jgi:hypothetical protein|tara:strand:- start:452 stop:628 length:177 start_codon:yes stop_codon:yes gene_type:complete
MPYKRVGKTVFVKKSGKWKKLATHTTERKAQGHVTALRISKSKRQGVKRGAISGFGKS